MVDSSLLHINATLFVSQCFQTFLSFNNGTMASDAERLKENADLSKQLRNIFLKFVFDTAVKDLKESEKRSKRDPNEHPVFFYDIFDPDFNLGAVSIILCKAICMNIYFFVIDGRKVFENFFVKLMISSPREEPEQSWMKISYDAPLIKLTGHARHKDILPIRNGVYYPSETHIELWNFSLNANLSSQAEETSMMSTLGPEFKFESPAGNTRFGPGVDNLIFLKSNHRWRDSPIRKYNSDDCRVEFMININGTERYPRMPEDRLSERLKDILCRKAVPDSVNSPLFNQLLRFLGFMATDKSTAILFEAYAVYENSGVEEAIKFLKQKEAEFKN
uniref:Uncharacterized protein n=1 Tax=Romanomermis culicivorax TaxID=13658 RepID=A0A915JZU6_ROMCU